jgi:H+/Cl- antiporter ClcA
MRAVRAGTPLRFAIALCAVLIAAGGTLVGVAIAASWLSDCPTGAGGALQLTGLDKGISFWPPGAQCLGANQDLYIHKALPWTQPVALVLVCCAPVVLALGLLASIARMREPIREPDAPDSGRSATPIQDDG